MNQPVVGTSLQSEDRSTDLRAKIIGILSDTANGCITELGYFPSLLRKFRELEQANNKWREENVRLFQDNRALAQYTRHQDEHIKTVASAAPDSANKIAMLEEQVKTLSIQNLELRRMNEALVAASSTNCNNAAHQRLLTDNQKFTPIHQRTIHHPQQGAQPNPFYDNSKLPKSSHQNIALPGQDPRQHAPTSQRVYPPSHPPSIPIGAYQQIAGSTVFHRNPSQPTVSPMPNLRMDYGPVLTVMQTGAAIPNIARSVPPQTSPISPVNYAHLPTTRRRESTQTRPPIVPNTQPYRRTSLTIQTRGSPVPHGTSNSPQNPPLNNDQCSYDGTGWGLLPNSPHSNRMPPSQSVPIPTSKSLPPQQVANQSLSPATRDFYMRHTSSVPNELLSPPDSASIQTPIGSNQETLPVEVVSSPWMAFDQMKREREDIGSDLLDTESAKKKIRLGEEDRAAEVAQVQDTSMDDESDQEIEVDSDGLRSISSCISELMENSIESPECYMCRLCDIRYKTGVISDAPKPLIGATLEQLVTHLTTEHADAWETLRHDV